MSLVCYASQNSAENGEPMTAPQPSILVSPYDLCPSCSIFCRCWEVLDWVAKPERENDPKWPATFLSNMAQLIVSETICQLCNIVLAAIRRRGLIAEEHVNTDIYLHVGKSHPDSICVAVILDEDGSKVVTQNDDEYLDYSFDLKTFDACCNLFDHKFVHEQEPAPSLEESTRKAREWITSCLADHPQCYAFHTKTIHDRRQRPSRVLEINPTSLRLRCNLSDVIPGFDYLVLSHMWGPDHDHQLRLLDANLEAFQKDIPLSELEASPTFKQAIQVTVMLGYRYLWIDSLCIIQKSNEDWNTQAPQMAMVYGNAVCNLAFLFPAGKSLEPTAKSVAKRDERCVMRPVNNASLGVYMERTLPTTDYDQTPYEFLKRPWMARSWPLFSRAWTFQEYLLCPRTLLLGHRNLMFQCSALFQDEHNGATPDAADTTNEKPKHRYSKQLAKTRYFPKSTLALANVSSLSAPAVLSFVIDWYAVVNEYRSRDLSYASDRIVAFAGVARAYQNIGSITYLAGLWKEILPLCLLWHLNRKEAMLVQNENNFKSSKEKDIQKTVYTAEVDEKVACPAPSWSWFSIPIYRFYELAPAFGDNELFNGGELSIRCRAFREPTRVVFNDIYWAHMTEFQFPVHPANHLPPSSLHIFGDLNVTLNTKILPVSTNWPSDLAAQIAHIRSTSPFPSDHNIDWTPKFEYFPDNLTKLGRGPPKSALLVMLSEIQIARIAGAYGIQRRFAGIVVVPESGEEWMWKRVGMWKMNMRVGGMDVDEGNLGEVAERWRERDFTGIWEEGEITLV